VISPLSDEVSRSLDGGTKFVYTLYMSVHFKIGCCKSRTKENSVVS
jgi:hypothetical protein